MNVKDARQLKVFPDGTSLPHGCNMRKPPPQSGALHIKPQEGRAFCAQYRLFVQTIWRQPVAEQR